MIPTRSMPRPLLALWLAAASPIAALAQPAKAPAPIEPKELAVEAAAAPVPVLRYRLLPSSADLNPGDAAPIYLRTRYETPDALWAEINPTYLKWRDLPLDRFPAAEARRFVDQFPRQLEQIAFAARRQACTWNYTVPEQRRDVINLAQDDIQGMRRWLMLLTIKARVEIAEKDFDRAIRTIETGLAFARHIAEGPTLIHGLMGLAGAWQMLGACEELIAQPGAPNLYWALTALPRPLVDFRREVEFERKLFENMIPELVEAESATPRTPGEWSALLSRLHAGMVRWIRRYGAGMFSALDSFATWDVARLKAESLPAARAYLKTRPDVDDKRIPEMSDDQVVALYLSGRHRELWDEFFVAGYLPPRDAIPRLAAAAERVQAEKSVPLALFIAMTPALQAVMTSSLKAERLVPALRTIEAIRLHAAAHGGKLPESLNEITEVPIPKDPATDEPFVYRAADDVALLNGLRADLPPPRISYKLSIRR